MAILTLEGVRFRAGGAEIIRPCDLALAEGEYLAIVGPSGCGKSTLLRLVAGLERATGGTITLDGRAVSGPGLHVPPEARGIGMVFQSYALWPHMDVAGNVAYGLRRRGLAKADRAARVAEALETVGLTGFGARRIPSLSGGQRQRVALARCLAMRPRLLLLDEPLANLDTHLREAMIDEFRRLHRATGTTIVHVTHDQAEAMVLADRIAVMGQGAFLQVDTPATLWREPVSAEVARFVGKGQVLPVEVVTPGALAEVLVFGRPARMRAPAGITRGPALATVRAEDILREPGGLPARILDRQDTGAAVVLTVEVVDSPGTILRLRQTGPVPGALGEVIGIGFRDGWLIRDGGAEGRGTHSVRAEGRVSAGH